MANQSIKFPHLSLPLVLKGMPNLQGGGSSSEEEIKNKADRAKHAGYLKGRATGSSEYWQSNLSERKKSGSPVLPTGMPLLLRVHPDSDLDYLRSSFNFEIVAEHEDGLVIIASEELDLHTFLDKADGFGKSAYGTGGAAKVFEVFGPEDQETRLRNILSAHMLSQWQNIKDGDEYIVDISIECLGTIILPGRPERKDIDTDLAFEGRMGRWEKKRDDALNDLDELQIQREQEIIEFIRAYEGEVTSIFQDEPGLTILPDSFTCRISISGIGLKDIALNYPYLFEVSEPDDIEELRANDNGVDAESVDVEFELPDDEAGTVCVIDSGIQEGHKLLQGAIKSEHSWCYVPGCEVGDVADYVAAGGHGTRVAGAVLFGELVPEDGAYKYPCWIENARVLDEDNKLSYKLFPPKLLQSIVQRFQSRDVPTRIFNHSINANAPCRSSRMSAWASQMDMLSWQNDILFVQSAGNIPDSGSSICAGIKDHVHAGRNYPEYLKEKSARIANPGQSFQAITVGSISYNEINQGGWCSFSKADYPSAFSRSGMGLWGSIKPDVVEYGGDYVHDSGDPVQLSTVEDGCPELVRSTLHGPSPEFDSDSIGTSYSAPKVSRVAGILAGLFPDEPALLYRALVINSARWPEWAEDSGDKLGALRSLGYGVPDMERASSNNEFRVTLISSGIQYIKSREAQIFQIPIPDELRSPAAEFNIRIDVTLSYVAPPRRTRRNPRHYLGTWLDWKSSHQEESLASFQDRILKDGDVAPNDGAGVIPWVLRERDDWGIIEGARRSVGTVQKDWAILPSHDMPQDLCIAVIGHPGWDVSSDFGAKFSLAVSFEAIHQDIPVYAMIQAEVEALVEVEAEVKID